MRLASCLGFIMVISCTSRTKESPINIVCTSAYVGDMVSQLVGSNVNIRTLMGPGVDPHQYKASLRDVQWLDEADVVVASGLHLEGKMTELLEKISTEKKVIILSDALRSSDLIYLDNKGSIDPHIWFDPLIWSKCAGHLSTQLNKVNVQVDSSKLFEFITSCKRIDQWADSLFSTISPKQRILVSPHDAFSYYGRRYKITVRALQGISTVSEYGLKEVNELSNFVIDNQVHTIFWESSLSPKISKNLVELCSKRNHKISLGKALYSDALGDKASGHQHYQEAFVYNTNQIFGGMKHE